MLHPSRKYYIIIGAQTTLLSNFPEGWKESNEETTYNESTGTLLRTYKSQSLTFYREGAELLKSVFEADGFDGVAELRIEERQSDYSFALKFKGLFEFQTYSYDAVKEAVTINIADNSDQVRYANRKDIKIRANKTTSIDGDTITSTSVKDVRLMPQNLVKQSSIDLSFFYQNWLNDVGLSQKYNAFNTNATTPLNGAEFYLKPPKMVNVSVLDSFNTTGYDEVIGTNQWYDIAALKTGVDIGVLEIRDYTLGVNGVETTDVGVQLDIELRQLDSSSNVIDTYSVGRGITLDETGSGTAVIEGLLKRFYLESGDKVQYLVRLYQPFTIEEMTIVGITQSYSYNQVDSVQRERDEPVSLQLPLSTIAVNLNDFTDDLIIPNGKDLGEYYVNKKEYTQRVLIDFDANDVGIKTEGVASGSINYTITIRLNIQKENGNIINSYLLGAKTVNAFGDTTIALALAGSPIEIDLPRNHAVAFDYELSFGLDIIDITDFIFVTVENLALYCDLEEISPPANEIEGHLWHDVLTHCMDAIVGTNKLYIEPSLIDSTNKLNLNSAYNLMLMRGSMIRGFTASELPLSCSFDELLQDIRKLFCVGMYYDNSNERFVVDYMTNIYKNDVPTTYDLGLIDDVVIGVQEDEIYKSIVVGNEQESGIEDFYVRNEGHNKTSYTLPVVNAELELNLATNISTDSTDIELTRRYRKADTTNISRNNDNKLYFVKCYNEDVDVYVMEQEERITVNNSPTYFANANLCLLPRIVIENNGSIIKPTLYKKAVSTLIQFQSSKYIIPAVDSIEVIDEETTETYNEQANFQQQAILKNPLWLPEKIGFSHYVNADIMSQILANPHRVWKGTDRNGNVYKVFARQIGLDKTNRESEWEMIRIFE